MQRLLGQDVELWKRWIYIFAKYEQLADIAPFMPTTVNAKQVFRLSVAVQVDTAVHRALACAALAFPWPKMLGLGPHVVCSSLCLSCA